MYCFCKFCRNDTQTIERVYHFGRYAGRIVRYCEACQAIKEVASETGSKDSKEEKKEACDVPSYHSTL